MDNMPIVISQDGTKKFVGVDELVPPTPPRSPNLRYCNRCHRENENDQEECVECGATIDDGKMECKVCHRWFDYLLGENENGGVMGCETCWKPPVRKEQNGR